MDHIQCDLNIELRFHNSETFELKKLSYLHIAHIILLLKYKGLFAFYYIHLERFFFL